MIVLDTNVVSELMRAAPAPRVVRWLGAQTAGSLATTAITIAEIHYGLARLPAGRRAAELRAAADDVLDAFSDQVWPFDAAAAAVYGDEAAAREQQGRPIQALDAQIAAVCHVRGAALATRNIRDFEGLDVDLIDPWRGESSGRAL